MGGGRYLVGGDALWWVLGGIAVSGFLACWLLVVVVVGWVGWLGSVDLEPGYYYG